MMAIRGIIAPKPKKKQHKSTMGFGYHSKVPTGETISTARRIIENINAKLETLCSSIKSQTSFNKMIETQIAQTAASILVIDTQRILGQPKTSTKFVHAATEE